MPELKAGRELDALVAFHLFGWRWFQKQSYTGEYRCALYPPDDGLWIRWNFIGFEQIGEWPEEARRFSDWDRCGSRAGFRQRPHLGWLPHYSTDIAAVWQVLERLQQQGILAELGAIDSRGWFASFTASERFSRMEADTAPLAICLAALCAVEVTHA